jgi:hypothetical protein
LKRQANAIEKGGSPQRGQFNAKVVHLWEMAMWGTRAKLRAQQEKNLERWKEAQRKQQTEWDKWLDSPKGRAATQEQRQAKWTALVKKQKAKPHIESATLTPAGTFTDAMASHIWKAVVDAAWEEPKTRSLIEQQFAAAESYGLHKGWRNKKRQIIEQVVAESYGFNTKERAMDAIHDLATQLQFTVKKQPGHKRAE